MIILGSSRVGKTTLVRKINKELGYSIFSIDNIITAFEKTFPQMGITHMNTNGQMGIKHMNTDGQTAVPFIANYFAAAMLNDFNVKIGINFAIEGTYFDFELMFPEMEKLGIVDQFHYIGLTINEKTGEDLFNDMRKHDTEDDWSFFH